MANRTEISIPLWVMLGVAAIVAMLLTFVAASISWGAMASAAGKLLPIDALLVLPLVIAAKYEWTTPASVGFAFFTYFVVSIALVLVLGRKNEVRGPTFTSVPQKRR
jgi:hypothetical protein